MESTVKYPLDVISKYRHYNHDLPQEFSEYKNIGDEFWRNSYVSCLNSQEIKAYLCSHISKKDIDEEDKVLYDTIQNLLNKLNTVNYDEIKKKILDIPYTKKNHLLKLCELIVLKSINESGYCVIYSKLSQLLLVNYVIENEDKIYFRSILLTICQDIFEELTGTRVIGKPFQYERSINYSNLGLSGLMKFLAELYNFNVLPDTIIKKCFSVLYRSILEGDEFYDEIAVFVKTFIKKIKKENMELYNSVKENITKLTKDDIIIYENDEFKFKFPKLMYKFKIMEIMEVL